MVAEVKEDEKSTNSDSSLRMGADFVDWNAHDVVGAPKPVALAA